MSSGSSISLVEEPSGVSSVCSLCHCSLTWEFLGERRISPRYLFQSKPRRMAEMEEA